MFLNGNLNLRVSIHQPAYLPWAGYFDKIRSVDLFIFLDTVQFQKGSFQNRNKLLTKNGPTWLTVPIITKKSLYNTPLSDIKIDINTKWQKKHWYTIEQSYTKAPNFDQVTELLKPFYTYEWLYISDLCYQMLKVFLSVLNIQTKILKASDLMPINGSKTDLVLGLCQQVGADTYLSGSQGRNYLDIDSFHDQGIDVHFQNYEVKQYPQVFQGFEPNMGIVDLLMCAKDPAKEI